MDIEEQQLLYGFLNGFLNPFAGLSMLTSTVGGVANSGISTLGTSIIQPALAAPSPLSGVMPDFSSLLKYGMLGLGIVVVLILIVIFISRI